MPYLEVGMDAVVTFDTQWSTSKTGHQGMSGAL